MPLLRHAIKKMRVDKRRALVNKKVRTKAKVAVKAVRRDPQAGTLRTAFSMLDRAVKGKVIHKGKADRLKSRLSKLLGGKTVKVVKKVVKKTVKTVKK